MDKKSARSLRSLGILVGIAALGVMTVSRDLVAQEKKTVTGHVEVTEDRNGSITALKLVTEDDDVYNITLDENGKKLGREMYGETVRVTGAVTDKDDFMWLTVEKFEKVKAEE